MQCDLGSVVGGTYRVEDLVGAGAMAEVYRVTELATGRTLAMKVMAPALAQDELLLRRFAREFAACAKLDHPNVVRLYRRGSLPGGSLYFTMDFLPHPSLGERLAKVRRLPEATALCLALQMVEGLGAAHRAGVVHRDVKPANLIVSDDDRLVVVDFGLARDLDQTSFTATGTVLGTPFYMAPELFIGRTATEGTDLFAVGVVLYEMLTGQQPHEASDLQGFVARLFNEEPRPLAQVAPDVSPAWQVVLDRALAREPEGRYASAEAMRADLLAVRDAQPAPSATAGDGPIVARPAPAPAAVAPARGAKAAARARAAAAPATPAKAAPAGRGEPAGRPGGRALVAAGTLVVVALVLAWATRAPRPAATPPPGGGPSRPAALEALSVAEEAGSAVLEWRGPPDLARVELLVRPEERTVATTAIAPAAAGRVLVSVPDLPADAAALVVRTRSGDGATHDVDVTRLVRRAAEAAARRAASFDTTAFARAVFAASSERLAPMMERLRDLETTPPAQGDPGDWRPRKGAAEGAAFDRLLREVDVDGQWRALRGSARLLLGSQLAPLDEREALYRALVGWRSVERYGYVLRVEPTFRLEGRARLGCFACDLRDDVSGAPAVDDAPDAAFPLLPPGAPPVPLGLSFELNATGRHDRLALRADLPAGRRARRGQLVLRCARFRTWRIRLRLNGRHDLWLFDDPGHAPAAPNVTVVQDVPGAYLGPGRNDLELVAERLVDFAPKSDTRVVEARLLVWYEP